MSATEQFSNRSRRPQSAAPGGRVSRMLDIALVTAAFAVIVATTLIGSGGF